jgi:hypothetical protein
MATLFCQVTAQRSSSVCQLHEYHVLLVLALHLCLNLVADVTQCTEHCKYWCSCNHNKQAQRRASPVVAALTLRRAR